MKVNLIYKGLIKIEKYKSGSLIEIPDKCTVRELISLLEINKKQRVYIVVNDEPAWLSTVLQESDSVKLLALVGGG